MPPVATRSVSLRTEIPGPRSRELTARREAATPSGLYKAHPIAVAHADGALVTDVDGNTFIDFVGGIGVLNAGHTPPEVVAAIQEQAGKLLHFSALVGTYEPYVELCERLNEAAPISGHCKTILANSGAEGVENAIKIARAATGRPAIIAFDGGYHGRTLLTLSLTSKTTFKKFVGPFAPEIYRAPFPYTYQARNADGSLVDEATYADTCITQLEKMLLTHVDAAAVAAIIIEPVQGEGGFIPVPPAYMRRLRELCDRIGALLIADEVQCGFGRTGTLFAMEQMGVEPDLLISAKSIAAGMPLAAVTGRAELMDKVPIGGIGGTYGGNPLACVAAIEVLRLMPELLPRASAIGAAVRERGAHWSAELPFIGDVRGLGGMMAIEIVTDRESRTPDPARTQRVIDACLQRGLLTMRAGLYTNCIRLLMPLMITGEQLTEGLDILDEALRSVA
ncbi:MAG TPA: aspartate aminotransferase family protein [Roseiflexaceae bacterium]|nr:aspartate aminotransferase family protein [Roseiflexaceae bacterium]HMP39377.1 aspartate aminotransferase family protein [Roseiflexaceae bacterium]